MAKWEAEAASKEQLLKESVAVNNAAKEGKLQEVRHKIELLITLSDDT